MKNKTSNCLNGLCMSKTLIILFIFSFSLTSLNGQAIGQTKAYLIKKLETCKITKNVDVFLVIDCDGIETAFLFDENGLCYVHTFEVLTTDWNEMQVDLMWNNAECLGKSTAPSPKILNLYLDVLVYSDKQFDYFFYNSDFNGNKETIVKAVSLRKHK
jgi:hypothetical protein